MPLVTYFLTLAASALAVTTNTLNIDPDLLNPVCGYNYQVNVNMKHKVDQKDVDFNCGYLATFIETNGISKDVDLVYVCPGTWSPVARDGYVSFPNTLADLSSLSVLLVCNLN